jgi:hypothetical protein
MLLAFFIAAGMDAPGISPVYSTIDPVLSCGASGVNSPVGSTPVSWRGKMPVVGIGFTSKDKNDSFSGDLSLTKKTILVL